MPWGTVQAYTYNNVTVFDLRAHKTKRAVQEYPSCVRDETWDPSHCTDLNLSKANGNSAGIG